MCSLRIYDTNEENKKDITVIPEELIVNDLLFHLQKLLDGGIILQRHERGDYMITDKGYKTLKGISAIYSTLKA